VPGVGSPSNERLRSKAQTLGDCDSTPLVIWCRLSECVKCDWVIRRWDSERGLYLRRIVHALQNTIHWCINSETDRRGYVLERRFTNFSEITQCNGHHAVQGHQFWYQSKAHTTSYYWLILTYLLSCTFSKSWLIIGQIFAIERGVPHFNALAGVIPANIAISDISLKTRFFGLNFRCRKYWCIFNHFYIIRPESYRIRWNYAEVRAIT